MSDRARPPRLPIVQRAPRHEATAARLASACLVSIAVALPSCSADAPKTESSTELAQGQQTALLVSPEVPSILRDVAVFRADKPVAPSVANRLSTSNDGRVTVASGAFSLNVPEKLTGHFWDQPGGTPISTVSVLYKGSVHSDPNGTPIGNDALCDGTRQFGATSTSNQPHVCDADDCYDLTIISPVLSPSATLPAPATDLRFWGAPVTVRVTQPKTATARVLSVTSRGAPVAGPLFPGANTFFEPMVSGDGGLLIGRVAGSLLDPETKDPLNIVYAAAAPGALPCDVTAWKALTAVSRASADPLVNQRYGFARYPFLDSEGTKIPAGMDIRATYPWLDREGRNLFVKTGSRSLYFANKAKTPTSSFAARCVAGTACTDGSAAAGLAQEIANVPNGMAVMGLWTHGRMVMVDGRLNNVDFGLGIDDAYHREVKLYGAADSPEGWVRAGTGRMLADLPDHGGNTGHMTSLENLFSYDAHLKPRTQRDVVWLMSTLSTEEVVFDDWLDPHAMVVSDMMPSWSFDDGTGKKAYRDGFQAGSGFDGTAPLRMQNAATAPADVLATPSYGRVDGPARAEPVALGGIFGRGFWMNGSNRITYAIPPQPRVLDEVWYTSAFVDARIPDDKTPRRLLSFPDNSSVVLVGRTRLALRGADDLFVAGVTLPSALAFGTSKYRHLGLRRVGTTLEVLVDGMRLQTADVGTAFRFPAGDFVVGSRATDTIGGVPGWIDEVRVFNEPIGAELACNHARGSLVGLDATAPADLAALAALYPVASHDDISQRLVADGRTAFTRYACRHDYSVDYSALSFDALPAGVTSVRSALLFPNGPLTFGLPRPDASANGFCLTCHADLNGGAKSLSVAALTPSTVLMQNDRRRQPLQPPRRMFGWVPASFIGPGSPATAVSSPDGELLDRWVFPR